MLRELNEKEKECLEGKRNEEENWRRKRKKYSTWREDLIERKKKERKLRMKWNKY